MKQKVNTKLIYCEHKIEKVLYYSVEVGVSSCCSVEFGDVIVNGVEVATICGIFYETYTYTNPCSCALDFLNLIHTW